MVTACADAPMWKYYGMSMTDDCYDRGTMTGKSPTDKQWPDLPLDECKPQNLPGEKGRCVIQLEHDFFEKDRALLKCQSDLVACQKGNPPI